MVAISILIIQLDHKKWSFDNAKDLEQTSENDFEDEDITL